MRDPHDLCASSYRDDLPVQVVLEAGRAVLCDADLDTVGEAVIASGILDQYVTLMTHPLLVAQTTLRQAVEAESEDLFYGWFDAQGKRVDAAASEAHYTFDLAAYGESLRTHWRTDGCIETELRRYDARRGFVEIIASVGLPLGAVRQVRDAGFDAWRIERKP